jgi:polyhydroxybutyrate depolymerase
VIEGSGRRWIGRVVVAAAIVATGACSSAGGGPTAVGSAPTSPGSVAAPGTTAAPCELPSPGARTIDVGGVHRTFDVFPPSFPAEATPVLVLFHGFNSTKEEMVEITGLADQAPAAGVVLVVPQGLGQPAGWSSLAGFDVDEAFTTALLDEVQGASCVDPDDVWLAGFSAGSAFAAVYGCTHPDRVEGLGLVAALAPAICPPDATPNVVITHGTADPVVPFGGGNQTVGEAKVPLASVSESAATWARRAGCAPEPIVGQVGDDVSVTQWTGCAGGSTITFEVVDGGGHAWPGAARPVALGRTTQTVSTSCVLLAAIADPALAPLPDCPGDGPPGT